MAQQKNYSYGKRPLWQWILLYIVIGAIVYGIIYYFVFAQKDPYKTGLYPTQEDASLSVTQAMMEEMVVTLSSVNNSGESGTATLKELNGKVVVTLSLTGFQNNPQPAHIHIGNCPGVGAVKYPLTNVVDGQSETTLDVTLAQLKGELPLAINVHQSQANIKNYTSCGTL